MIGRNNSVMNHSQAFISRYFLPILRKKGHVMIFILGCSLGLIIAFYLNLSTLSPISNKEIEKKSYLFLEDNMKQYHPLSSYEKTSGEYVYKFFDSTTSSQLIERPSYQLTKFHEKFFGPLKNLAFEYANKERDKKDLVFHSGWYRWLGNGFEFQLSFQSGEEGENVQVIQLLDEPKVIRKCEFVSNEVVNIILTLQGRMETYKKFLDNLVENILPVDPYIRLYVVYFKDKHLDEARKITDNVSSQLKVTFVTLPESSFSKGKGFHVGANSLTSNDSTLLFFCDAEVIMRPKFFSRCRSNTALGKLVYYPIVFSLYNPKLVYQLLGKKIPPVYQQLQISENTGIWRSFGYGMACMHYEDYNATGGFMDRRSWGLEDVDLHQKIVRLKNIRVLRSPDPDIFHVYHNKDCTNVDKEMQQACRNSKVATEGSQMELGIAMFRKMYQINVDELIPERVYDSSELKIYLTCFGAVLAIALVLFFYVSKRQVKNGRQMNI